MGLEKSVLPQLKLNSVEGSLMNDNVDDLQRKHDDDHAVPSGRRKGDQHLTVPAFVLSTH